MNLVITGSSSGIGRALTEHLLKTHHTIWGLARSSQQEFEQLHPGKFHGIVCDVSDWQQVAAAAAHVSASTSSIEGLVACAGVQGEVGRAMTADPARWSATIRANLDGTYFPVRAFHPLLARTARRAKIVCLSGGGATKARANFSAYGAAKTGVVRLVESIAEEERSTRLDINAIAPGALNTRLTDEVIAMGPEVVGKAEYESAIKQKASGGGSMATAIGLIEWLLSPASDGISGRLLAAQWDPWRTLDQHVTDLAAGDIFTLRRIGPDDRGKVWQE